MEFFQGVVGDAEDRLCRCTAANGLRVWTLSKPDNLENPDVDSDTFKRLAVAYGLSFDSFDIGDIEPPSRIPDIPPLPNRDWRDPDAEF